ncbi:hypothetical protein SK128_000751 [Halocaridina rubra]|uniref:Uncharacterized protein n=1 Tax=Halocaridina rubra TaxID=373956 RepID=A0AAN8XHH8_HALRR
MMWSKVLKIPEEWPKKLNNLLQSTLFCASEILVLIDVKMCNYFDIYLFLRYLLGYFLIYCIASLGFGWLVCTFIYLVLIQEKKNKVNAQLALAYIKSDVLKAIYYTSPKERPSWVSVFFFFPFFLGTDSLMTS